MLDAVKVLNQPFAWEGLKRALKSRRIRIESLGKRSGLSTRCRSSPNRFRSKLKMMLVRRRQLYYLLQAYDPDFAELFKVAADFEEHMERTPPACARPLLARQRAREKLLPLTRARSRARSMRLARPGRRRAKLSTNAAHASICCTRPTTWPRGRRRRSSAAADQGGARCAEPRADRLRAERAGGDPARHAPD